MQIHPGEMMKLPSSRPLFLSMKSVQRGLHRSSWVMTRGGANWTGKYSTLWLIHALFDHNEIKLAFLTHHDYPGGYMAIENRNKPEVRASSLLCLAADGGQMEWSKHHAHCISKSPFRFSSPIAAICCRQLLIKLRNDGNQWHYLWIEWLLIGHAVAREMDNKLTLMITVETMMMIWE